MKNAQQDVNKVVCPEKTLKKYVEKLAPPIRDLGGDRLTEIVKTIEVER